MFTRTTIRRAAAFLAAGLLFTTATAQGRIVAASAKAPIAAKAPVKPKNEAPEARAIIAHYANGHILTADKLYSGNGEGYEPIPVWTPEPAVITRSGQLKDGTWRIHLRTQSGIEGYVDLAHPKDLSHFLKRANG